MPLAAVDEVRSRVHAMQAEFAASGSRCRLLTREPPTSEAETWMEIYEGVAPGFDDRVAAAASRHRIAECVGIRHVERFVEHAG